VLRTLVRWQLSGESWRVMVAYCYYVLGMSIGEAGDYLGLRVGRNSVAAVVGRIREAMRLDGLPEPKLRRLLSTAFKYVMDLRPLVVGDYCTICGRVYTRVGGESRPGLHLMRTHGEVMGWAVDVVTTMVAEEVGLTRNPGERLISSETENPAWVSRCPKPEKRKT
jgi:hypothetical protein